MPNNHRASFVHNEHLSPVLELRKNKIYSTFYKHATRPSSNVMVACPIGYNSRSAEVTSVFGVGELDRQVAAAGVKHCVALLSHTLCAVSNSDSVKSNPTLSSRLKNIHRSATTALRLDATSQYKKEMIEAGTASIDMRS